MYAHTHTDTHTYICTHRKPLQTHTHTHTDQSKQKDTKYAPKDTDTMNMNAIQDKKINKERWRYTGENKIHSSIKSHAPPLSVCPPPSVFLLTHTQTEAHCVWAAFRALLDNCLADAPLQHRVMLQVALEDRWGKARERGEVVGDGNREDGGWGEHGEKVEGVGVDVEEEAGDHFVLKNISFFHQGIPVRLIFRSQFVLLLLLQLSL